MFWSCSTLRPYWAAVLTSIKDVTGLTDLHTWEAVSLGIFRRPKTHKVYTRFASLAMLLAKRAIAMKWRDPLGPSMKAWAGALRKCAAAEEETLREEEIRGHRKRPISLDWAQLLHQFTQTWTPPGSHSTPRTSTATTSSPRTHTHKLT